MRHRRSRFPKSDFERFRFRFILRDRTDLALRLETDDERLIWFPLSQVKIVRPKETLEDGRPKWAVVGEPISLNVPRWLANKENLDCERANQVMNDGTTQAEWDEVGVDPYGEGAFSEWSCQDEF